MLVGADAGCGVVLFAVHGAPVELPAGGEGDSVPVDALHAPVAFAERVNVVDLLVVVRELVDERGAGKVSEVIVFREFGETDGSSAADVSVGKEELRVRQVLPHVDRTDLSCPVVYILEEVEVDALQLLQIVRCRNRCVEKLECASERQVSLRRGEFVG